MESVPPPPSGKLTSEEAQKIVALWGERLAQKDAAASMPSVRDLSEALGVSEAQVESLLAEVRRESTPPPKKPKVVFTWRMGAAAAGALVVMGALAIGAIAAIQEARMTGPSPRFVSDRIPSSIELPPVDVRPFVMDLRDLRHQIDDIAWEPLDWGSVRTLNVTIQGTKSDLELQSVGEWTAGDVLTKEIARLANLHDQSLPPLDTLKFNEPETGTALEELLNSLSVGSNRGWENVFRMKDVKLQAGGEAVTIRIPVLAFSSLTDIGGGEVARTIQEAVKRTQAIKIREGLRDLHARVKRSGQAPVPASAPAQPIILAR